MTADKAACLAVKLCNFLTKTSVIYIISAFTNQNKVGFSRKFMVEG